jgi:formylmethanofuran dehydrogenase subunit E
MDKRTIWEKCVAFHGHECGGLTIGYKAALYASELMNNLQSLKGLLLSLRCVLLFKEGCCMGKRRPKRCPERRLSYGCE